VLNPGVVKRTLCAGRRVRNASLRVDTPRPALTGHGRRFPAGFGSQGGHQTSLAARSDSPGSGTTPAGVLAPPKERPDSPLTYVKGKRDSLGG